MKWDWKYSHSDFLMASNRILYKISREASVWLHVCHSLMMLNVSTVDVVNKQATPTTTSLHPFCCDRTVREK